MHDRSVTGHGRRRIERRRFVAALRAIEDSIEAAWCALVDEHGARPGTVEDHAFAEAVIEHPDRLDWRVVDGALKQLRCPACVQPLGSGPTSCGRCEVANGSRFAALEADRPGVPVGNEHALRVASAVARTRDRYTPRARCGYEVALPDLLAGDLPTFTEIEELVTSRRPRNGRAGPTESEPEGLEESWVRAQPSSKGSQKVAG